LFCAVLCSKWPCASRFGMALIWNTPEFSGVSPGPNSNGVPCTSPQVVIGDMSSPGAGVETNPNPRTFGDFGLDDELWGARGSPMELPVELTEPLDSVDHGRWPGRMAPFPLPLPPPRPLAPPRLPGAVKRVARCFNPLVSVAFRSLALRSNVPSFTSQSASGFGSSPEMSRAVCGSGGNMSELRTRYVHPSGAFLRLSVPVTRATPSPAASRWRSRMSRPAAPPPPPFPPPEAPALP